MRKLVSDNPAHIIEKKDFLEYITDLAVKMELEVMLDVLRDHNVYFSHGGIKFHVAAKLCNLSTKDFKTHWNKYRDRLRVAIGGVDDEEYHKY